MKQPTKQSQDPGQDEAELLAQVQSILQSSGSFYVHLCLNEKGAKKSSNSAKPTANLFSNTPSDSVVDKTLLFKDEPDSDSSSSLFG